jgi:hypothetical protein
MKKDAAMFKIINAGGEVTETNYFDSEHAKSGLFFVSWNASVARVLVPDGQMAELDEMRTGRICVISRGPLNGLDCIELMFDDGSAAPYALHVDMRQTDRAVPDEHKPFTVAAWTRAGKVAVWPAKYRLAKKLPCLARWVEH